MQTETTSLNFKRNEKLLATCQNKSLHGFYILDGLTVQIAHPSLTSLSTAQEADSGQVEVVAARRLLNEPGHVRHLSKVVPAT